MPFNAVLSSFGAIRMEQCSHQTLKSQTSTAALSVFFINFVLFRWAHAAASESVTLWRCCSRPYARIPGDYTSAIAFRPASAALHPRYDRSQIRLALHTCGSARRDTIWHQVSTIGQYASELQGYAEFLLPTVGYALSAREGIFKGGPFQSVRSWRRSKALI